MGRDNDQEKTILNWIWLVGAVLALLTQFVMAVWYFAHMDSRIANLEYTQNHIVEKLNIDVGVTNKAENDILVLKKDNQHQNYRIKVTEDWMNAWIKRAEDKGQETKK